MKLLPILYQSIGGARLGFCPMSIEDLAAQQRRDTTERAKRHAKRQDDAVFLRTSGSALIGGDTVSVSSGSNGPFIPGQAAAFLGPGVVDVPSRGREQVLGIPVGKKIDLKILASGVDSAGTHIFIGGDRRTPTEILVLPVGETISFSRIENLGVGLERWIVAIKTTTASGAYKIYTKFGEDPSRDWQIQDPKARILNYFGRGFWSGLLEKPPINFETIATADEAPNGLTFFFNDRPGEVRGVVNMGLTEVEFWRVPEISKTYLVAASRGFLSTPRANLVPIAEWNFTGTNTLDAETTIRTYWAGQPPILPQYYPFGNVIFWENLYRQNRTLSTQYPSFYANNGAIQVIAGSYLYTEHRESKTTYIHRRYQGLDIPAPDGSNYDIGYDDALTISTSIQIGPTVSKPLTINPGPRTNLLQYPTVTVQIPSPIENFEGALVYSKYTGIADFNYTGFVFNGLIPPHVSPVTKQYLRLEDGTEKETKFSYSYQNYLANYFGGNPGGFVPDLVSWRKESENPILRNIGNLPNNSSAYTPSVSPLLKEKYTWAVVSTTPIDNAGVLDYTASTVTKTEESITTYAVTLSDALTAQRILDAR
jgi:hypothetical protein